MSIGREIICTRPDGTEVKYPSITAAAQAFGVKPQSVAQACITGRLRRGNKLRYAWERKLYVTAPDGSFMVFNTASEAAKAIYGDRLYIATRAKQHKPCYGYKVEWRYENVE